MWRNSDARSRRQAAATLLVLAAVNGFAIWDAFTRSRHLLEVSAGYGVAVDAPAVDPHSPTGYADGRRSLMLPPGAGDSAHWVMHTQGMIAGGDWRIRNVGYDNAPEGREVHWASPLRWWLALLAWVDHSISGRPIGVSVERAALWSGPLMFGLLLCVVMPLLNAKFSRAAGALFALGSVAMFPFFIGFRPGAPDHHGLANICALLTVLGFVAGSWVAAETTGPGAESQPTRRSRTWFLVSGIAGGVGLWISAATQVPVLIGVGLGILGAAWLAPSESTNIAWLRDPTLLRVWASTGGVVSLAAYLLEYFPGHLGWRLEVNHPLYALAWIGGGETLRVIVAMLRDGRAVIARKDVAIGLASVACVLLLPLLIGITGERTFTVRDAFVWQLHSRYISEFQNVARYLANGMNWSRASLLLPALLLIPPLLFIFRSTVPRRSRALLLLAEMPALVAWVAGCVQLRWLGLAFAMSIPLLAVFFFVLREHHGRVRTAWLVALALLFVPGAVNAVLRTRANADITPEEIRALAERDVAHWLRLRAGATPVVVASGPTPTTNLISFGGLRGLGTLYWENSAGLKKAAELFAAPPEQAHAIARRLGVTHIVVFSWSRFEIFLAKLHRALPEKAPIPADSLIATLLSSPVPPSWLRPLPFQLPEHPALAGDRVQIWEVGAEQSPATALTRAANYYLEMGDAESATRMLAPLAGFDHDLAATVMRAGIAARQQDAAAFARAFERVLALSGAAADLSLEQHVHLVVVLTVGQRLAAARDQLQAAMMKVDEPSLRQLTSGTLSDLVSLSRAFQIELPNAELAQLAQRLLPPDKRG